MRTTLFAGILGVFFIIAVIGALSVSPILDSDKGNELLASVFDRVMPEPKLEESIVTKFTRKDPEPDIETANSQKKVLGSTTVSEKISLDRLYGLINGSRSDLSKSTLLVSRELETAAQMMLLGTTTQADEALLTVDGESSVIQTKPVTSDWEVIQQLQQDPRQELLLHSTVFTQMGGAIRCDPMTNKCATLFILGTH